MNIDIPNYWVNQSLISKWLKNKDIIINDSVIDNRKFLTKHRLSEKYNELFSVLLIKFREARGKRHPVSFNRLWNKARVIYRIQLNDETAVVEKYVVTAFSKPFNTEWVAVSEIKSNQKRLLEKIYKKGIR